MENATSQISVTSNYDRFKFLTANRERGNAHVERLKAAFVEFGNLTRVQPILVNDRWEIIDGQHRFQAAMELNEPIYYTVAAGLGVNEARSMNILHKPWTTDDFAHSYADSGDANYRRYLELREEFPSFSHSVLLVVINRGSDRSGMLRDFREGNLTITPEDLRNIKAALAELETEAELIPAGTTQKELHLALVRARRTENYDHHRMVQKLQLQGGSVPRFGSSPDYLRALEDVYNYRVSDSQRARLF